MKNTILLGFMLLFTFAASAQSAKHYENVELLDYATRKYIDYMPKEDIEKRNTFGSESIPQLIEMLNDPDIKYKSGIIAMLAGIKDGNSDDIFREIINYFHNIEYKENHTGGAGTVLTALGKIARNGNLEIIEYLENWADPFKWNKSHKIFPNLSYQGLEYLSQKSISALGNTGHPKAMEILQRIKSNPSEVEGYKFSTYWFIDINEAIEKNESLQEQVRKK